MKLEELRNRTNLKQKEYAKLFHLTPATYCNYENGKTQPPYNLLIEIADYHKVSIDYILERQFNNQLGNLSEKEMIIAKNLNLLNEKEIEHINGIITGMLYAKGIEIKEG